jgi:exonuclease VII small subunit
VLWPCQSHLQAAEQRVVGIRRNMQDIN